MTEITLDHVRAALALTDFDPTAASADMTPGGRPDRRADPPPRQAGVLALLVPDAEARLSVILTRRTDRLAGHSGQMSFPGGRREPSDASFEETALRETSEELGIETEGVAILGALTPIYIPPSHFDVYPFVGHLPALPRLQPNADEVAAVFVVPLIDLLDAANRTVAHIQTGVGAADVPAYLLCDQIVWGATAIMLHEFEVRLRHILTR